MRLSMSTPCTSTWCALSDDAALGCGLIHSLLFITYQMSVNMQLCQPPSPQWGSLLFCVRLCQSSVKSCQVSVNPLVFVTM